MNRASGLLELARIVPDPDQPRKEFEAGTLEALAQSIRERGVLQPIRVRWDSTLSKWILIAGERRYRAAQKAGLEQVPVVMVEGALTAAEILEEQLIENLVRQDLKPIEHAQAFSRLITIKGCTGKELAGLLAVDPATVSRALALLKLDDEIQDKVDAGTIAPKAAVELAKIPDRETQKEIALAVVEEGLTAQEVQERVRQKKKGKASRNRITTATFRTAAGGKVTVTFPRKAEAAAIIQALEEALAAAQAQEKKAA